MGFLRLKFRRMLIAELIRHSELSSNILNTLSDKQVRGVIVHSKGTLTPQLRHSKFSHLNLIYSISHKVQTSE